MAGFLMLLVAFFLIANRRVALFELNRRLMQSAEHAGGEAAASQGH